MQFRLSNHLGLFHSACISLSSFTTLQIVWRLFIQSSSHYQVDAACVYFLFLSLLSKYSYTLAASSPFLIYCLLLILSVKCVFYNHNDILRLTLMSWFRVNPSLQHLFLRIFFKSMHFYVSPSQYNIKYVFNWVIKAHGLHFGEAQQLALLVCLLVLNNQMYPSCSLFCSLQSNHRNSENIWETRTNKRSKISEGKRGSVVLFCVKREKTT